MIHDRVRRSWRHLDFFQFEAWLHADVPRIQCSGGEKTTQTTQMTVPWAREGSGFTLLFETLGLSLCRELPVSQAANELRVASKRLWRRIRHYVQAARAKDDMALDTLGIAAMKFPQETAWSPRRRYPERHKNLNKVQLCCGFQHLSDQYFVVTY